MEKDFVHLHMHTEYSLLDGANKIKELVSKVKQLNMNAVAITDHGNMFGAIEMYKECKKQDIKAIIGCEMYVARRGHLEKEGRVDTEPYHLILLAMNNEGYKNLTQLCSIAYVDGFYYKPRVDIQLLEKYSDNLIALSGCMAGEVACKILDKDFEGAKESALKYKKIFKDRYYFEIQDNKYREQLLVNQKLIEMSKQLNIPLVATNDCHYLNKEDYSFHEALLCIQTKKKLSDSDRMRFETNEFYVKSKEEMYEAFSEIKEAVSNTQAIADKCNVTFEFGKIILPEFHIKELDENNSEQSHFEYFRNMCYKGMNEKYPKEMHETVTKRLEYELSIIEQMGFIDYFLIVADYVQYAKSKGISVGPGRGSGAGSVAAYLSSITDIDPIRFGLIFERFLNPERISMPDFDIDFCFERRQEVIDYVCERYGKDHVAQIITFGTMKARGAIRDVARVLDIPYQKADEIAKLVPMDIGTTLTSALEQNAELKSYYESDEQVKQVIDMAMKLEGLPRHASTHAAGVVITRMPVAYYVPLYVNQEQISTQYTMTVLEELGLLKMDFLGLRTLTVIQDACYLINKIHGVQVVFDCKYDDKAVYKMLSEGKTTGVFQLESGGFRKMMKDLGPTCIEDIIVMLSLYRPGPMEQIPRYIKGKNTDAPIEYTHPALEPILKETYGCMVYQEQVMQIFRELAGYSLGRADLVRRAMGKKKIEVMNKEREIFIHGLVEDGKTIIDGAVKRGVDESSCNKIFDEMAEFAKYAFNKSHAAAYAVISYQTAYLKTHYPAEFMAATMNSFIGNLDKVPEYIAECKSLNIPVLRPDINESYARFAVINKKIRFALTSIKNIGTMAIDTIVKERKQNGKYTGLYDFLKRVTSEQVNKKCIESLIKAGAFDEVEPNFNRYDMLASFEQMMDGIVLSKKNNLANQISIFELNTNIIQPNVSIRKVGKNITKQETLDMEKEMMGIYVSGHPLDDYIDIIQDTATLTTADLNDSFNENDEIISDSTKKSYDKETVTMCGVINNVKTIYTKKNQLMAFCEMEDMFGTIEIIVFPTVYAKHKEIIHSNLPLSFMGEISEKDEEKPKLLVNTIAKLSQNTKLYIKVEAERDIEKVMQIVKAKNGETPVYVYAEDTKSLKMLARKWWVDISSDLIYELKVQFGTDNVKEK